VVLSSNRHIEIIILTLIFIYIVISIPGDPIGPAPVKVTYPYGPTVYTIDISSNGTLVGIGYDQGFVRVWDLVNGEHIYDPGDDIEKDRLLRTLGEHNVTDVESIKFSPDDRYLLSVGSITVYDREDTHFVLREEDERINASEVILWDVSSGQRLQSYYLKNNLGRTVAFSPDSKAFAATYEDKTSADETTINIWSTETGEILNSITTSDVMVESLAFTPDGNYLVASYLGSPRIVFWDLETMEAARVIKTDNVIRNLDFSNEGNIFAGMTQNGHIIVWDTESGNVVRTFTDLEGYFGEMDMSADGEYVAGIRGGLMMIWNVSSGEKILDISTLPEIGDRFDLDGLQFSPDSKYLAAGVRSSKISPYSLSMDNYTRARSNNVSFDLIFGLRGTKTLYLWDFQDIREGNYIESFWDKQRQAPLFYLLVIWFPVTLVVYFLVVVIYGIIQSKKNRR